MPRAIVEDNIRLAPRVRADDKAMLMRAVALTHTDMTDFILRHAMDAARKVIEQVKHLALSARDSQRVLDALENPPAPNAKLMKAARRMPKGALDWRRSSAARRAARTLAGHPSGRAVGELRIIANREGA